MTDTSSVPVSPRTDDRHEVGWLTMAGFGQIAVAGAAVFICCLMLARPTSIPIGAMYWDVVVYLDGGWRVLTGQTPSVDFFAPVGPLGYWLFAAGLEVFPHPQPLLLAQWMLLPITLPALLPVVVGLSRTRPGTAWALLLPILFLQLVPVNVEQYSTLPGFDGYGIYNRHVTEVLYVLVAALLFERRSRVLLFTIAWCCTALFLIKITGFIAAGIICSFAFATGRVPLHVALWAAGLFLLGVVGLEVWNRFPSHYIGDILTLVQMNEGGIAGRFVQAASIHFGIFGSGLALLGALLWVERHPLLGRIQSVARTRTVADAQALLDSGPVWLAVLLAVGLFFESQNTGGQAFIFLWPLLLVLLQDRSKSPMVIGVLVAAVALPPAVNIAHRTMRAVIGQFRYELLPVSDLKGLAQATQRPESIDRAEGQLEVYATQPAAYQALADQKQLPIYSLYSDTDFQVGWLIATQEAVEAVQAYETQHGVRFASVMSLNFVNPYPYLLERNAPPRIAIGADPYRAVPPLDAETAAAVRATDLVLFPKCPLTSANIRLREVYADGLSDHREMQLSRCWTAYVRNGL